MSHCRGHYQVSKYIPNQSKIKPNPEAVTIVSPDKTIHSFCLPSSAARWLQKHKEFETGSITKVLRVLNEMLATGNPCQKFTAYPCADLIRRVAPILPTKTGNQV